MEKLIGLMEKLVPRHPWRYSCVDNHTAARFWPSLILSLILVAITIVLDSQMVNGDYASIEFAFTIDGLRTAFVPFQNDFVSNQVLCVSGGLHFFAGAMYFTFTTVCCAWAANHDRSRVWGDLLSWVQFIGWLLDIAGQSLIVSASIGSPPAGLGYADIVITIWGLLLVFKNVILAVGIIYPLVIRILVWTSWKDDEPNTTEMTNLKAVQATGAI